MTASAQAIDLSPPVPDHIKTSLDARLGGFDFESDVILVQVPQFPLDMLEPVTARGRGYFAYPPQNLLYLSAIFRELGIQTRIVDLNYTVLKATLDGTDPEAVWRTAMAEALEGTDNPLICMSLMFDSTSSSFHKVLGYIRDEKPGACVAAGGVAATADPERLLRDGIDLVFSHEGENALDLFYRYIRDKTQALPINLSFLDASGQLIQTPSTLGSPIEMDVRPDYSKVPISDYHKVGCLSNFSRMNGLNIPYATIISRRGCRAKCSFCGVRNFNGKGVRVRNTGDVIEEMKYLYDNFGIRHFDWLDDDLLYSREDAIALFNGIAEHLPEATWAANNGVIAAAVTREVLESMRASHCVGFKIGLESGNPQVLRDVHKPTSLDKFFKFADLAQEFPEMFMAVNFIMGFPGERLSQMLDSFGAAIRGKLDWNSFYVYQHLKNTELYIAHGSMGGGDAEDKVRTNSQPMSSLNPVRGGLFKNDGKMAPPLSGYDIMMYDTDLEPSREQLKEIWFTFNFVVNFLYTPAIYTDQTTRLKNSIRWMEALSRSYPDDPSMTALLYFLHLRLNEKPATELDALRSHSKKAFANSEYWQRRDEEFHISAFLDGTPPDIDPRLRPYLEKTALDT